MPKTLPLHASPVHRSAVPGLAIALALLPSMALGWWNGDWASRKALRVDASAAGANITEPIGAFPLLVRLHAGNFRFDAAREDGSDLRFIASDDKTPLKHHLEKYDALLGEALIWVAVPDLKPGAKAEIWLYYHNPKAPSVEDPKGTYDAGTALVYHFADRGQAPKDSSVWANNSVDAGASADGALIGTGLRLDGTKTVSVPSGPSLAWQAGARMTWSAWVRPAEADATGAIFSRRDGARGFVIGVERGKPFLEITGLAGVQRAASTTGLASNSWHHLAVVAADGLALYVDGFAVAKLAAALPALDTPAVIGGDQVVATVAAEPPRRAGKPDAQVPAAPAPLAGFKGDLDELQIAKVDRPAGFIQAAVASQGTDPGKFLAAGQDEESGSFSSGYFAIILKSVTLDGWVVIGLLAVMSFISLLVMASKASYLGAVERANHLFTERFQRLADLSRAVADASPLGDEKAIANSPLYRIFRIAVSEIRKRTHSRRWLSAEAIEAIRATLGAGLVRENQRLSRRMVLLTIAISGGPFLGLLGTVVGVMITFASIAAAGDVNVNAIAPGIAAALVATVAGLAVAIPALFGYNWLLTRVKDVTATMQIFVDELVTKMAESYADGEEPMSRPVIRAAD